MTPSKRAKGITINVQLYPRPMIRLPNFPQLAGKEKKMESHLYQRYRRPTLIVKTSMPLTSPLLRVRVSSKSIRLPLQRLKMSY